jgi:hypothetical protein
MEADEGGATPFPREDMVMAIYDERPSSRVRHMSNPSPGAPAHYNWVC